MARAFILVCYQVTSSPPTSDICTTRKLATGRDAKCNGDGQQANGPARFMRPKLASEKPGPPFLRSFSRLGRVRMSGSHPMYRIDARRQGSRKPLQSVILIALDLVKSHQAACTEAWFGKGTLEPGLPYQVHPYEAFSTAYQKFCAVCDSPADDSKPIARFVNPC